MASPAVAISLSPDNRTLLLAAAAAAPPGLSGPTEPLVVPEQPAASVRQADLRVLDLLCETALGDGIGTDMVLLSGEQWKSLVPGDPSGGADVFPGRVGLVLARTKQGRPPVALAVDATTLAGVDDGELLSQLAQACALALEALRSQSEEHALVLTLQRTFLPDRLPQVPGVDMAVRYEAGRRSRRDRRRLLRGHPDPRRPAAGHR